MISIKKAYQLRSLIEQATKSLDDEVALTAIELFPAWKAGKAYVMNDRVRYEGELYKVLQDHTSQIDWTPNLAVSLFSRVADPSIEYPEWIQPTGAHDAYMNGDKVSHNGKHWVSTVDTNVWEPGVYGWEEV